MTSPSLSWVVALAISFSADVHAVHAGELRRAAHAVDGEYIVVLKSDAGDVSSVAADMHANVRHVFGSALHGFSAEMSAARAEELANDPRVAYVQENGIVEVQDVGAKHPLVHATAIQNDASWGLDRIDQRALPLSGTYSFDGAPANVDVYVLDTGIRLSHSDFAGRAAHAFDSTGEGPEDCNGHGTGTASVVGGGQWGVAKGVSLYSVKVLKCSGSGTFEGVGQGIDFVAARPGSRKILFLGAIGGASQAIDDAATAAIAAGVLVVAPAGNSNADACNFSPGRVPAVLTVGSTDMTDARVSFSNVGTCIDLFAPGRLIQTAWNASDTDSRTISGTPYSAAFAAGAAALYWAGHPSATAADVSNALVAAATPNVISDAAGSPNLLLYTGGLFTCSGSPATAVVSGGGRIAKGGTSTVHVSITGGTPPFRVALTSAGGAQTSSSRELDFTVGPSSTTTYAAEWISDASSCAANASGSAEVEVQDLDLPTLSPWMLFLLAAAISALALARMRT
ncbi:MAG: S8 family peptidase [Acidobacteria bacterium]|nr:S8 family peptidase [Acidobacteriota bacterium]